MKEETSVKIVPAFKGQGDVVSNFKPVYLTT